MRQPGIEAGSIASNATMLTFTPPTLLIGHFIFAAENFNILWNDDEILYNTSTRELSKTQIFYYKDICVSRESNPDLLLGRQQC